MKDLPKGIDGFEAIGKLTSEDYEKVLKPFVENVQKEGRHIRFLYRFGSEFEGVTPGAAWQDFHLGLKCLSVFERCAVVTDREWLRSACGLMAPLIPCPFRVFGDAELTNAKDWLSAPCESRHLEPRLIREKSLLVIELKGPLTREDFELLSAEVDPWIKTHHSLHGLVVHAKRFPGWENLGSFFRHIEFIGGHHRQIRRVALSAGGILPEVIPEFVSHFVQAEIKHFGFLDLETAIEWAAQSKH